jgi:3-hydroxyacyl-[acyl-carrier-protein] dehydratase
MGQHDGMHVDLDLRVVDAPPPSPGSTANVAARLVVPAAHPLLAGHFPGAPLVAGVQLLDAACRAVAQTLGRPLAIAAIDDVRWFQPVAPGVEVALAARVDEADGLLRCEGEWTAVAGRVASFRMQLRAVGPRP